MNILLLKMDGSGTRFGSQLPKQFITVNNLPIFCHVFKAYAEKHLIDRYVLVTNEKYIDLAKSLTDKYFPHLDIDIIPGGATNAGSVKNGVLYLKKYMSDEDILLIHDATNPIVMVDYLDQLISACKKYGVATLGNEQVHGIFGKDEDNFLVKNIDKKSVVSNYSPEVFYTQLYMIIILMLIMNNVVTRNEIHFKRN